MDLKTLQDLAPWDWPAGTDKMLLALLRDERTSESDLRLAVACAGEFTVIDGELVAALLHLLRNGDTAEEVRGGAAIALGPVLEYADSEGFADPADRPIRKRTFDELQQSLRRLYADATVPRGVRRRILEASVRAAQDWHAGAVRAAYASDDEAWRLTAVFCMRFVRGFDEQVLAALDSENPEIRCQAVAAAGVWGLQAAWPRVAALVASAATDKTLRLAAIDAAASIGPHDAAQLFDGLADSDDKDIAAAVEEALATASGLSGLDDDLDDDDELR